MSSGDEACDLISDTPDLDSTVFSLQLELNQPFATLSNYGLRLKTQGKSRARTMHSKQDVDEARYDNIMT